MSADCAGLLVLRRPRGCVSQIFDFSKARRLRARSKNPAPANGLRRRPVGDDAGPRTCCAMNEPAIQDRIVGGMAGRYATALFELARDADAIDQVAADLEALAALIAQSPELARLVRSPVLGAEDQLSALSVLLERMGVTGLAANFVKLVTSNRRLFALPDLIRAYKGL